MWSSALGIAAKLGSLLSLAFVLVGRRSWLKMSNSPMIKSVIFRELFDFLSVVRREPHLLARLLDAKPMKEAGIAKE